MLRAGVGAKYLKYVVKKLLSREDIVDSNLDDVSYWVSHPTPKVTG